MLHGIKIRKPSGRAPGAEIPVDELSVFFAQPVYRLPEALRRMRNNTIFIIE
jgi:hypothetical protein